MLGPHSCTNNNIHFLWLTCQRTHSGNSVENGCGSRWKTGDSEEVLQFLEWDSEASNWSGEGVSGSCDIEEFIILILKCLGQNGPLWESDAISFILNSRFAPFYHQCDLNGREAKLVSPLHEAQFLFQVALEISNHIIGVGEIKNEKQHLSRVGYLCHALRPTKQMGTLRH